MLPTFPDEDRLTLLRRGRGAGFRAALAGGTEAFADVLGCVLDDPRYNRQGEAREAYYAALLLALDPGAGVDAIEARIRRGANPTGNGSELWLPIGVLAELAARRHPGARGALARLVREGVSWHACLDALGSYERPELVAAVISAADIVELLGVVGVEAVAEATCDGGDLPWDDWALDAPRLRFVVEGRHARAPARSDVVQPVSWVMPKIRLADDPDERNLDLLADDELLALERSSTEGRRALGVLGRRGHTGLIDEAETALRAIAGPLTGEQRSIVRAYRWYIAALPAEATLERARRWVDEASAVREAGEHVLREQATADDRLHVEAIAMQALADGDMDRARFAAEALGTIGAPASVPVLAEVYRRTTDERTRSWAVQALVTYPADPIAQPLLVEALWDCSERSRELACAAVALDDTTIPRLRELAADEHEGSELVEIAASRLAPRLSR